MKSGMMSLSEALKMLQNLQPQQPSEKEKEVATNVKKVTTVEIEKAGSKLVIPDGISYDAAIKAIQARAEYEEGATQIRAEIDAFVLDAAYAFNEVLTEMFGFVNGVPRPEGMWGDMEPPTMMTVRTGLNSSVQVPWGRFKLTGIGDGYLETNVTKKNGVYRLVIGGQVRRKYEEYVNQMVEKVRKYVKINSIYKNKAIRIRFRDSDGDPMPMPEPEFMDLTSVREDELVYSAPVQRQIATSIFTPIEHTNLVRESGIPLKRGVLLCGQFGVGKSMTAAVTAVKALRNGWTFISCERADELGEVIRFAQRYGPAVLFCEDIDRVVSGERTLDMDAILELIDGVEAKSTELMVILTTNAVEEINQAMFRPGRLDAIIEVTPPDAEAVERLCRLYGRGLIPETEDLREVGMAFSGQIPAVVREMVERAKLHAIRLGHLVDGKPIVTQEALLGSAEEMTLQRHLLTTREPDTRSERVKAADSIAGGMNKLANALLEASGVHQLEPNRNGENIAVSLIP